MIRSTASFYKHVTKVISCYWSRDSWSVSLRRGDRIPGVTGQCTFHPSVSYRRGIFPCHFALEDCCDCLVTLHCQRYSYIRNTVFVSCAPSLIFCHRVRNSLVAVEHRPAQSLFLLPFSQSVLSLDCDFQRLSRGRLRCCRSPPRKRQPFSKAHNQIPLEIVFRGIYQTRETVFHRDIQTPRRNLKIRRAAEYCWQNSRSLDIRWNTASTDVSSQSKQKLRSKRRNKIVKIYA